MSAAKDQSQAYVADALRESIAVKQLVLGDKALIGRIVDVADVVLRALRSGNKVIFAGNGGSAADSQHLAAEFVSRFMYDRPGLPALALNTDTSMLTAIGNDYGFEHLFERQIEANGRRGDVFIGISTSGNSKNILRAIVRAKEMGLVTVGLAGKGGAIQTACDYVISVPSQSTPRIQESHIAIGHAICGLVEASMFPRNG